MQPSPKEKVNAVYDADRGMRTRFETLSRNRFACFDVQETVEAMNQIKENKENQEVRHM